MEQANSNLQDMHIENENIEDIEEVCINSEKNSSGGNDDDNYNDFENSDSDSEDELYEKFKKEDEEATGLEAIKFCRNEDKKDEDGKLSERLNLRVSTWMGLYFNLIGNSEEMAKMRDVSIGIAQKLRGHNVIVSEFGSFTAKFESASPYYFFLTTVNNDKSTFNQPYSVSFHEIIDYTLGEIVDSLHINFVVELSWIVNEYMIAAQNPKMTILYGLCNDPDYEDDIPFDINFVKYNMPDYGCFHSKVSILKYKDDKIRIIISTANMYSIDWDTRTQGLWISPLLPLLPIDADHTDGESVTNFKKDFIKFLNAHNVPDLFGWESLMYRTDFSSVNVFFWGSIPGYHKDSELNSWGRNKLNQILEEHAVLPSNAQEWPVVAQSSAVGSFGINFQNWLIYTVDAMSREKDKKIVFMPDFKFIYPSQNNFAESYDGSLGLVPLVYNDDVYSRQIWFNEYLYQWKADKIGRSLAMPHSKTYTRISPDGTEIPWFVLTSANLGKGAWGKSLYNPKCLHITNYESGVVFIPKLIINQNSFPINEDSSIDAPTFLLPYDWPLTKYDPKDEPFITKSEKKIL